jgi:hypothetical protein
LLIQVFFSVGINHFIRLRVAAAAPLHSSSVEVASMGHVVPLHRANWKHSFSLISIVFTIINAHFQLKSSCLIKDNVYPPFNGRILGYREAACLIWMICFLVSLANAGQSDQEGANQ